jgi:hypothetical protein
MRAPIFHDPYVAAGWLTGLLLSLFLFFVAPAKPHDGTFAQHFYQQIAWLR